MPTKISTKIMLLLIITFFACNSCSDKTSGSTEAEKKTTEPAFDLDTARKSIDDTNQALSDLLKKGDSTGFASYYCTDAKIMAPDGPAVAGRDAIKSTIGYFYNIGLTGMELKTLGVWGSEALVAEEGTVVFTMKDGKEYDHGKYIVLWKMEDGKWKLFRDIFNTDIAKAPGK